MVFSDSSCSHSLALDKYSTWDDPSLLTTVSEGNMNRWKDVVTVAVVARESARWKREIVNPTRVRTAA
jgi:hypothetical protein